MPESPRAASFRPPHPNDVDIPLQSDPKWLSWGIFALTAACVAAGVLYFRSLHLPNVSMALGLLPGLTVATFASAALAWWGRKRSHAVRLRIEPGRVIVQDASSRELVVDRALPFAAVLVVDRAPGRRALVLSQRGEPTIVLDTQRGGTVPSAWADRTITMDLSHVALSPASANVLTVSRGGPFEQLLTHLGEDCSAEAPLVRQPLPSGHVMVVHRDEASTAASQFPVSDTIARRTKIPTHAGQIDGLSLVRGADAMLLASSGGAESIDITDATAEPEAVLSPLIFEIVASRFEGRSRGAEPSPHAARV